MFYNYGVNNINQNYCANKEGKISVMIWYFDLWYSFYYIKKPIIFRIITYKTLLFTFLSHDIVSCSFKYLLKTCHAILRLTLTHHRKWMYIQTSSVYTSLGTTNGCQPQSILLSGFHKFAKNLPIVRRIYIKQGTRELNAIQNYKICVREKMNEKTDVT